jgi:cation diffusion facilitator CzcD-associated flavoprotein CzcO
VPAITNGHSPTLSVAIVGAGFSGIGMAIALRRAGIESFQVFERAESLGGVWHHNTYPGAACDVPSYLYSYSYEQRSDWSQPCSPQAEILEYLRATATSHGVDGHVRLGTEIASARWEDEASRWVLETTGGERIEAGALVVACGQLSRPAWPRIEGAERFAGESFHSAQWDHDIELDGRRVAVIGTGASAVQFVPEIAARTRKLSVFQRSAAFMLPRRNPSYPAPVRALIRWVPGAQRLRRLSMWLVMETFIMGLTRVAALGRLLEAWSRAYLWLKVRDRSLRRALTPDYPFGCKRILFSTAYYEALAREDVDLVTEPIREITERGVVTADGREHQADVLVYGTGFRSNDFVLPMAVSGTEGRDLQDAWRGGAEAHLGMTVAGFPNAFMLYGPNTNLGVGSIIAMIEAQVGYVIDALRTLDLTGARALDVRPEVQSTSGEALQARLRGSVWTRCANWYRDPSGRVVNNWPGHMVEYVRRTRRLRAEEYRLLG